MMNKSIRNVCVATMLALSVGLSGFSSTLAAGQQPPAGGGQQPAAGQPPEGRGRGQGQRGGGGGRGAQPLNMDDRSGFESIFDGTMKNWDGDPAYWKAVLLE